MFRRRSRETVITPPSGTPYEVVDQIIERVHKETFGDGSDFRHHHKTVVEACGDHRFSFPESVAGEDEVLLHHLWFTTSEHTHGIDAAMVEVKLFKDGAPFYLPEDVDLAEQTHAEYDSQGRQNFDTGYSIVVPQNGSPFLFSRLRWGSGGYYVNDGEHNSIAEGLELMASSGITPTTLDDSQTDTLIREMTQVAWEDDPFG